MKNRILALIFLVAALAGLWYISQKNEPTTPSGSDITWVNADENMITLELVRPGVNVLPKFTVTGSARGPWYFEASFPVEILDKDGKRLDMEPALAIGDWMTEEFVPFRVELDVGTYSGPATIVLHKSNASGEPERDASMSVPVEVFKAN